MEKRRHIGVIEGMQVNEEKLEGISRALECVHEALADEIGPGRAVVPLEGSDKSMAAMVSEQESCGKTTTYQGDRGMKVSEEKLEGILRALERVHEALADEIGLERVDVFDCVSNNLFLFTIVL